MAEYRPRLIYPNEAIRFIENGAMLSCIVDGFKYYISATDSNLDEFLATQYITKDNELYQLGEIGYGDELEPLMKYLVFGSFHSESHLHTSDVPFTFERWFVGRGKLKERQTEMYNALICPHVTPIKEELVMTYDEWMNGLTLESVSKRSPESLLIQEKWNEFINGE